MDLFIRVSFFFHGFDRFCGGILEWRAGMGFGVISTSLLMAMGIAPTIASASTRIARISVTLIAGVSHWKFGNLQRDIGVPMILPGIVGGVFGAYLLCSLSQFKIKPFIAGFLLLIGIIAFFRLLFQKQFLAEEKPFSKIRLGILAFLLRFLTPS